MSGNTSATGGYIIEVPPSPPGVHEIAAGLQQMIVALTGLPGSLVRPRWQRMPPTQPDPETTWASIGVTRVEADAYPYITHDGAAQLVGTEGKGVDRMQRHLTVSVLATFYGPEAELCAGSVRDGLYMNQNWEPLASLGLKLRDFRDLARNAELINQQWVDRFDVLLELRQQIDRVYPVLNIEGADVVLHSPSLNDQTVTVREDTEVWP